MNLSLHKTSLGKLKLMDKSNGAQKTILNEYMLMMAAWHCLCISSDIKDIYIRLSMITNINFLISTMFYKEAPYKGTRIHCSSNHRGLIQYEGIHLVGLCGCCQRKYFICFAFLAFTCL